MTERTIEENVDSILDGLCIGVDQLIGILIELKGLRQDLKELGERINPERKEHNMAAIMPQMPSGIVFLTRDDGSGITDFIRVSGHSGRVLVSARANANTDTPWSILGINVPLTVKSFEEYLVRANEEARASGM